VPLKSVYLSSAYVYTLNALEIEAEFYIVSMFVIVDSVQDILYLYESVVRFVT